MVLAPAEFLVVLDVVFVRDLETAEVEAAVRRLDAAIVDALDGATRRSLILIEPAAPGVARGELIDRAGDREVDSVKDGALARAVPSIQHDEPMRQIEANLLPETPEAAKFDEARLHPGAPRMRATSAAATRSSSADSAPFGAIVAILFCRRAVRSSLATAARY